MSAPYRENVGALRAKKAALESDLEHLHARNARSARALGLARQVEAELLAALHHVAERGPFEPMEPVRRQDLGRLVQLAGIALLGLALLGLLFFLVASR